MRSVWSFPLLVLVIFGLLTVLGISGTSAGIYHKMLHGVGTKDPGLLYGQPKSIRSDEYLIFTPRVALQTQTNYPAVNEKINSGRDVVITPEAPMKDWVGLFRPHTFAYFVLPFSNAFAFSWWFGFFTLVVSCYFFLLRILDKRKLLAILLSLSFALSPFILWWFQISLLLSLSYFFMAAILLIRLLNREKARFIKSQRTSDLLHAAALIYIGASLGLLLYAPFLIPIAIVLAFFITGYVIDGLKAGNLKQKQVKESLFIAGGALLVIAVIGAAFYFDRREMIKTIANSLYPGERLVTSGYLPFSPIYRFFDSFLMPLLPKPPTGSFYINQSEASNFILLLPFLLMPGILLQVYEYRKNKRLSWTFLLIQLLAVLFMVRITLPIADGFFKLFLLDRVPNNRLLLGVGLLGLLQLAYLIKNLEKIKFPKRQWLTIAAIFSGATLIWLAVFSKFFFHEYLSFKHNYLIVGSLGLFFTAIVAAFLFKRKTLGTVLLLAFTVLSSFRVLPLQKGMGFFEDSKVINKIKQVSAPNDSWAVVDNFTFESLPLIAGRKLINGQQPYTDFEFWRQIDKDGKLEDVYNRQGHAIFVSNTASPGEFLPQNFARVAQDMELVKGNVFKVRFACNEFAYKNIDYILITHEPNMPCLSYVDEVGYPRATFYIYRVARPN